MPLSIHGKRQVALSMYRKGTAFIAASILLSSRAHDEAAEYVAANLLAQGIEVSLKGLLLLHDYDHYVGRLQKRYGHKLLKVAQRALCVYQLKPISPNLRADLIALGNPYFDNQLRYGHIADLFISPSSIPRDPLLRRMAAVIRLAEKHLRPVAAVI